MIKAITPRHRLGMAENVLADAALLRVLAPLATLVGQMPPRIPMTSIENALQVNSNAIHWLARAHVPDFQRDL
jgi:hypothetical protein